MAEDGDQVIFGPPPSGLGPTLCGLVRGATDQLRLIKRDTDRQAARRAVTAVDLETERRIRDVLTTGR